ncbi:MAG: hypothetical protein ACREFX_15185 [Opitutaceae bacterium]
MNFKVLLRVVVFLAILFAVLYMGINNTKPIEFSFPMLLQGKIRAVAALIYFGVFAVGVLGGAVLTAGGGGGRRGSGRDK